MSKSQEAQTRQDINTEKGRISGEQGAFQQGLSAWQKPWQQDARKLFGDTTGLYKGFTGPTGGVANADYLNSGYKNLASTGGYDPSTLNRLKQFYGSTAITGGYTPQALQDIRGRSNAAISSNFATTNEMLRRQKALQGGYSPGYTAALAKSGRGQAESAATTARDTEAGIAEAVRSGRMEGAGALDTLQQSERSGRVAGLGGVGGVSQMISQGQQFGTQGLTSLMGAAMDENGRLDSAKLQSMGLNAQQVSQMMSLQEDLSKRPGVFQNIMQGLGAVTGAMTGIGGLGGLGGGIRLPSAPDLYTATNLGSRGFSPNLNITGAQPTYNLPAWRG